MPTPVVLLVAALALAVPATAAAPNIIFVLADDLGWGDPQSYQPESKTPTPNIDRLAREGLRFTDAHSPSAVCTPTRYTLLTGRYSWRTRLKQGVLDGFDPPLIGSGEDTLALLLRRAGYRTACVGKWHLGLEWQDIDGEPVGSRTVGGFRPGDDVDYTRELRGGPLDVGFDTWFGISASLDMAPYVFLRNRSVTAIPTERLASERDDLFSGLSAGRVAPGFEHRDVLPRLAEEAVRLIETHADEPEPFFLYLPLTSPHLPIVPTQTTRGHSDAGRYGDFVVATDHALGRVLEALDRAGATDDTLVLFTSDNGGLWHSWDFRADDDGGAPPVTARGAYTADYGHHSNARWRGTKADIYEGGHRVPFLVRWSGEVEAGRVTEALVELTDVYATVAEIVGVAPQGESGMDSFSFLPVLRGAAQSARPFAVHHSLRGLFALRQGDWKLIEGRGSGGFSAPRQIEPRAGEPVGQLYHLGRDAREQTNRYAEEPGVVARLAALLDAVKQRAARQVAAR